MNVLLARRILCYLRYFLQLMLELILIMFIHNATQKFVKNLQKKYKEIGIYYIGYVTVKQICSCNNISSVNPLYLMTNEMIGHFEEKNENKYLVLDEIDENKEVLNKYKEVWEGIKKEIETINGGEKIEYGKDF